MTKVQKLIRYLWVLVSLERVGYFALPRLHYDPLTHGAQCHKTIVGPFSMQGYQALF